MLKRIIHYIKLLLKNITSPELIAGVVIAVTVVAVTINTSSVIMQNYTLERDVRVAEQKVAIAQAELDTQKLKNNYYKSDAFMDIAARKQLNKGVDGEKLMIVPKSVALSYVSAIQSSEEPLSSQVNKSTLSNPQKWGRFLSGKLD